jgi:hypothetical protein
VKHLCSTDTVKNATRATRATRATFATVQHGLEAIDFSAITTMGLRGCSVLHLWGHATRMQHELIALLLGRYSQKCGVLHFDSAARVADVAKRGGARDI